MLIVKSNFYEELLKNDFYEEKTASDNSGEMADMLESFSSDELEVLAAELGVLYEKTAAEDDEEGLESLAEDRDQVKDKADKDVQDKKNEQKVEGEPKDDERDATGSEQAEEAKLKAEKREMVIPEAAEGEQIATTAEEESEDEIIKVAYDIAAEKLAAEGYTLEDYVFSKVANEDIAYFIADKAEKLAYLADKNPLQVADDILFEIENMIGGDEE